MFRRIGVAAAAAGLALAGLSTGTAAAQPACADFHWIGAAGSGQRDGAGLTANGGMGDVVYQSYQQLRANLLATGRTITAEAVEYPASPVPLDGGIRGWLGFLGSVDDGADATADQFEAFTEQCPNTKVVLAGYSQGAMVIHRNLYDLADNPQVAAALLVADGDRLPVDTTLSMGSAGSVPGVGKGVAQEHSFLASTNTSMLPPTIGSRTVSVCALGDPVCDYDPDVDVDADSDTDGVSAAGIAIHTSYVPASWAGPLFDVVMSSAATPILTADGTPHGS